jgi:CheY-like chemotaxis protein
MKALRLVLHCRIEMECRMDSRNKRLNVLMIEDDPKDIFLTMHYLKQQWTDINYLTVDKVPDMMKALGSEWDVILCDYHLPLFSGLTALRMIRDSGIQTPFILVSGQVSEDVAAAMMQLGANDYVMKGNLKRLGPAIEREVKAAAGRVAPVSIDTPSQADTSVSKREIKEPKVDSGLQELLHVLAPMDETKPVITERHKAVVNILLVAQHIREYQTTILEKQNLTQLRLNILRILKRNSPEALSLHEIKAEVFNKSSDLSRMLQKMEEEQLVSEAVMKVRKRGKYITITPRGLEAIASIDKYAEEMFLPESVLSEENAKSINEAVQGILIGIK